MPNVEITLNSGGKGEVFVDGRKVEGVLEVSFSAGVALDPLITLTLLPKGIRAVVDSQVVVNQGEIAISGKGAECPDT